jgi:2-oxoglutarate ferredoxin oxidoreductase subunit gamma
MAAQEIIFAGFGGQGILSMGKFLVYAGMEENLNVTWFPSYGVEMRGGTSNCSVILSDEEIGSPIVAHATSVIVMNRPSLDKFERMIVPGGVLILDSNLVDREPEIPDVNIVKIPAQRIAEEIGSKKIANMLLLGALVEKINIIPIEALLKSLKEHGKEQFYELNKKALEEGAKYAREQIG